MIYREYLVMRKALAWFAGILLGSLLLGRVIGAIHFDPGGGDPSGIGAAAGWTAAIFASIFGVALGNGSREPARVLWVLPSHRWKLALQVIGVDLLGATAAFACGYAIVLLILALAGIHVNWSMLHAVKGSDILMDLAMAYATYGWSAMLGMLGRRVPYSGMIALPALLIWMLYARELVPLGAVARAFNIANPFVVFNVELSLTSWARHHFPLDPVTTSLQWLGTTWETSALVAITIATCGLAAAVWQRAETIN